MKYNFIIVLLTAALFSMPLSLSAMEYQHKLEAKDMQFSWSIEGDLIHVMLSAKTTGWVGIGFDPVKAMKGSNFIIGMVKNGEFDIQDHYGNRKRGHANDEKLGGKNDVLHPSGSEENGITTILFSYPLNTGDKFDKPINPEGISRVLLSYGAGKDSFRNRHPYKATYDINLSTGESKKIK